MVDGKEGRGGEEKWVWECRISVEMICGVLFWFGFCHSGLLTVGFTFLDGAEAFEVLGIDVSDRAGG